MRVPPTPLMAERPSVNLKAADPTPELSYARRTYKGRLRHTPFRRLQLLIWNTGYTAFLAPVTMLQLSWLASGRTNIHKLCAPYKYGARRALPTASIEASTLM